MKDNAGLSEGNLQVTGESPAHRFSKAEKVSIWWRHHWEEKKSSYRTMLQAPIWSNK